MGQVLHGSVHTTEGGVSAIKESGERTNAGRALQHQSKDRVKWKKRNFVEDVPREPKIICSSIENLVDAALKSAQASTGRAMK
jgi:hypothetical protein